MVNASIGELIETTWTVIDDDGVTPIEGEDAGAFVTTLLVGTVESAQPVTISETDVAGIYAAEFIPDVPGRWLLRVLHEETGHIYECSVDVGGHGVAQSMLVIDGNTAYIEAWLERNGQGVTAVTSCSVDVRDRDGVLIASAASMAPDARGHFTMSTSITVTANRPYNVITTVNDARGAVRSYQAFGAIQ